MDRNGLEKTSEQYVSVIGSSYLFPIASLLDALLDLDTGGGNEVQASSKENGYSVAIIVIAFLMIESAVNRAQYLRKVLKPHNPYNFVRTCYPQSEWAEKVRELSVLRDVIAHNHLWEAHFTWDDEAGMKLVGKPQRQEGYGDGKFDEVVDTDSRLTKILGLNVFPTRINYSDVKTVLKTTVDFLLFLKDQDRRILGNIASERVRHRGKLEPFFEIVRS